MKKRFLSLIALAVCSVMLFTMTACKDGATYSVYYEKPAAHAFTSNTQVTELNGYEVVPSSAVGESDRFVCLGKLDDNSIVTYKLFDLEKGAVVLTVTDSVSTSATVNHQIMVANNFYAVLKRTTNIVSINTIATDEGKIYNVDGELMMEKTIADYTDPADALDFDVIDKDFDNTAEAVVINDEVYDIEDGELRFAYNTADRDMSALSLLTPMLNGEYVVYRDGSKVYVFNWKQELTCYYQVPASAGSDYDIIFLDNGDFIVQYILDTTPVMFGLKTLEECYFTELVSAKDGGIKELNCKYVLDEEKCYTVKEAESFGVTINGYAAIMFGVSKKVDGIDLVDIDVVLGIKENGTIEEIETLIDYQQTDIEIVDTGAVIKLYHPVVKQGDTYIVRNVKGQTYIVGDDTKLTNFANVTASSEQNYIRDGKLYDFEFNEIAIPEGYEVAGLLARAVVLKKDAKVDNAVIGTEYYFFKDGKVTLIGTDKFDDSEKIDFALKGAQKIVTATDGAKTYSIYNVEGASFATLNYALTTVASNTNASKILMTGTTAEGVSVYYFAK